MPDNPRLRELVDRAQAAAVARATQAAEAPAQGQVVDAAPVHPAAPASTRLRLVTPERAILESNLARKGLWTVAPRPRPDEQLVLALDAHDRLGLVRRIDDGPALGIVELEIATWLCSRWRENAEPGSRRVPLSLAGLLSDFGWGPGGAKRARLAAALDALVTATFGIEIYDAKTGAARFLRRFHVVDEWAAGDPHRPGRLGRAGHALISEWLREQLLARHFTYLSWDELRGLDRPVAKRLLVFLEAEKFQGGSKRWPVDETLLVTMGLAQSNLRRTRQMLTAAGTDIVASVPRYAHVAVERRASGPGWVMVAERRSKP